jgi:hypothetical protein
MGNRKRQGMYLSPTDDAQLVQELERCTVRGRKSDLLRNYALLGYQRALSLCANAEQDHSTLTQALAELFAPDDTPPDFRSAAEFIKARGLALATGQGSTRQGTVLGVHGGATSSPAPAAKPPQEDAPADAKTEPPKPKSKSQWGSLQSLVGGSSKDKDQGGS